MVDHYRERLPKIKETLKMSGLNLDFFVLDIPPYRVRETMYSHPAQLQTYHTCCNS